MLGAAGVTDGGTYGVVAASGPMAYRVGTGVGTLLAGNSVILARMMFRVF